ncbi:MAG: putative DNA binding domain-containing protein, partial [Prevotellaceae bacterium]|nr:putative DNA binding domain-containing protein [Prevotellaceae bacterium]
MNETQYIEYKSVWKDEYLKVICSFSNAFGGVLELGKNDLGKVVGLAEADKLMEDLPNKTRSTMGILADVHLLEDEGKQFIKIIVNPYPHPISYHGKYYYRSGSTTQVLSGNALDEFILRKQGKTWDSVPVPYVKAADLDIVAFREFRRKALMSKRLTAEDLDIRDDELLENLMLTEGDYLKRAAVLLFHPNPEKYVMGAYLKIGFFETNADLLYQDEIHGPLITMPDKAIETIYLKYFKAIITYKGIQRVETYPVPRDALREALLNAIVHRDYSSGSPIQVNIYK